MSPEAIPVQAKLLSGLAAICLALVHCYAGKLRFLNRNPRSRWLSFGSGISVAYVFVHLLPELGERQEAIEATGALAFLESHIYLLTLLGLTIFYGLEKVVSESQEAQAKQDGTAHSLPVDEKMSHDDTTGLRVFWLHIALFAAYNALIGYLLVQNLELEWMALVQYTIAMIFHFLVNDDGLRQDHRSAYDRTGRWVLMGSILIGWTIGLGVRIPEVLLAIPFAILAGSIILNVLKEELPEEKQSRFGSFVWGVVLYSIILLTT